ncbi:Eco57I restriction-modification methylase domain-containing protein [Ornithinibacillus contaminans]|uniref:Eco57I restriction-modification methylase domain-containing protein n=1 Tax=Ornithinibacillus contaminans TaxID=694055 RepID=UPI00064D9CE6|nr:TaqI-like C-terminal specificity domain-containing protein [Ornithinibacillus contaminans]
MYESAKLSQLKKVFESKYDINLFQSFVKEFFNEPEMLQATRKTGIWREYSDHVASYSLIAKYTDRIDNELIILSVELKKNHSVDRARTLQRNFISKVLEQQGYDAAIVAFYVPDETTWRLSFVRLDYTFDDKGLSLDLTPARRYSYLVGEGEPNHTAQKQLLEIFQNDDDNPLLDEIENAFSVEKVTKDFYKQYELKYLELKEYLEDNTAFAEETARLGFEVEKFAEQFAKKLMGQLAFLYFLQKKGWLGVRILPESRILSEGDYNELYRNLDIIHKSILDKTFIKTRDSQRKLTSKSLYSLNDHEAELFSDCFIGTKFEEPWGNGNKTFIREIFTFCQEKTNQNFFDDFLEPLFYEALNKKRKNQYFQRFNCKIPFLNGGLFEPLEGYRWKDVNFKIPNEIFSNVKDKGKEADGILDIFDRFNFTINEAEPLEMDVAVDPEMLGKIFENLLEVKDRKSKGAYYTPREIVHYMCQESLINYLSNEIDIPRKDIEEFILYGDLIKDVDSRSGVGYKKGLTIKNTILQNIVQIDNALKNITVADPAVGSGAFPLGMLSEIVRARNNITEYLIKKDKDGFFGIVYGEEVIRKKRSPYYLKWETIKNSIFAVDIEASAVDIAKLRLWLSVIVEQEINADTPDPHPLPNLDVNILVGNSLIDEYEGIKLFDEEILKKTKGKYSQKSDDLAVQLSLLIDNTDELLKDMFVLQDKYFDEEDERKKKELKQKIDGIREDLIEYKLQHDGNDKALEKYKKMRENNQKPYFLWKLEFAKVFREKGGFDVVIGNPPYVGESGNKDIFRPIAKTGFGSRYYQGKMDLFYFFFHLGLDIGKDNSEISFITTNYFPTAFGAKKLRSDLLKRSKIRKLINFNELKIFDSARGQHNMITILTKNDSEANLIAQTCITNRIGNATPELLSKIVSWKDQESSYFNVDQDNLYEGKENYIRLSGAKNKGEDNIDSILYKMGNLEERLGDIVEINQGVVTGCDYVSGRNINKLSNKDNVEKNDGIFVFDLTNQRDKSIIDSFNNGKELLRDFYKNSDISKYNCSTIPKKKIIYYEGKLDIDKYPDVYNHLLKFKEILEGRLKTYNEKYHWTSIHRAREERIFLGEKIVVPYRSKVNAFAFNNVEWFCRSDAYVITPKTEKVNLKYLLGLLNSKPYFFWLYYKGKRKGEVLELFQVPLSEIPLPEVRDEDQKNISKLVDGILELSNSNNYAQKSNEKIEFENRINSIVCNILGFSQKEIDIIEQLYPKEERK